MKTVGHIVHGKLYRAKRPNLYKFETYPRQRIDFIQEGFRLLLSESENGWLGRRDAGPRGQS